MIQTIGRWLDYLSYVFQSTNRHGIHSPFVYSFADSILYKPNKPIESIEYQRTQMIQSKSDFFGKSLSKFVDEYTLNSKYTSLLFRISQSYKFTKIREWGLSTGIETNYLLYPLLVELKLPVSYEYRYKSKNQVKKLTNENLVNNYSNEVNSIDWSTMNEGTNLEFINFTESSDEVWNAIDELKNTSLDNTVIIISNIRHTDEHYITWRQICNMEEFTVSIELFRLGILYFRRGQVKEHFSIRY